SFLLRARCEAVDPKPEPDQGFGKDLAVAVVFVKEDPPAATEVLSRTSGHFTSLRRARPRANWVIASCSTRYGSGFTGCAASYRRSNPPALLDRPMRGVRLQCRLAGSRRTGPCGASMAAELSAPRTARRQLEPAFCIALPSRCTAM